MLGASKEGIPRREEGTTGGGGELTGLVGLQEAAAGAVRWLMPGSGGEGRAAPCHAGSDALAAGC